MGTLALGIDIGGTFTDIVLYDDEAQRYIVAKEPTTASEPSQGATAGTRKLLGAHDIDPSAVSRVVHATTLFTNALIERKGARTGLLTTTGFADVLEMGRERKYELYDLFLRMPEALVPRPLRFEVAERVDADGAIRRPLADGEVLDVVASMRARGVESLAVSFLHAYANPAHERRAVELIRDRYPDMHVTASHDVVSEIGEYERTSTAVANAYIQPLAHGYLDRLVASLQALGIPGRVFLMLSSGGLTHVEDAKQYPIRLLESGPAAGALAGSFFGGLNDENRILAFDMGGTTAKACIVDDREPTIAYEFEAAREKRFMEGSGLPLKFTTVELIEVGAGGGSEARVDALGLLKVGPESAGSEPGPACYGLGGTVPTVTDADMMLGYLDPDYFLGGEMAIDVDASERAFAPLAERTGLDAVDLAWGIHDVVKEKMASAARVHIAEKGKDPRPYSLLATGGAGPVHAYYVARKLGLSTVICPPSAGVGSAIGLLMAPARVDRVQTYGKLLDDLDWHDVERAYGDLERDAHGMIEATQALMDRLVVRRRADMRFAGQGFDLVVDLPPGPYDADSHDRLTDAFMTTYRRLYSRAPEDVRIELVNLRVEVRAPITTNTIDFAASETQPDAMSQPRTREAYFPEFGGFGTASVYRRDELVPERSYEGPAIIEEPESTLIVGPGATFLRQATGNIVVHVA